MKPDNLQSVKRFILAIASIKRYFVFLILILLALLFGKNFNEASDTEEALMKQVKNLQKSEQKIFEFGAEQKEYKIPEVGKTIPGVAYRLLGDIETNVSTANAGIDTTKLSFSLSSDLYGQQKVGEFDVNVNHSFFEATFLAENRYSDLLVTKNNLDYNGRIAVSNIQIIPLNINSLQALSILRPTLVGDTKFTESVNGFLIDQGPSYHRMTRKREIVGQTFTTTNDLLSKVELNLKFVGTGGDGKYLLELLEADGDNSKKRLAYYYFNKESLTEGKKFKEENLYQIPLPAKVDPGKQYLLQISNIGVEFNYFNTLEIGFYPLGGYQGGEIHTSVKGKSKPQRGDLFFKIFGANYEEFNKVKLLTGSVIQDFGNGEGLFSYKMKPDGLGYLDIDTIMSSSANKNQIFFDSVQEGISGQIKTGSAIIFRFDTIYPFSKMIIDCTQIGEQFTKSKLSYSLDKKNWQSISSLEGAVVSEPNRFIEQIVSDTEQFKTVYLKIEEDSMDNMVSKLPLFGIKSLSVEAGLIIK